MTLVYDLADKDILTMAAEDYRAARESRRKYEERKLEDIRLYRTYSRELEDGGKTPDSKGQFGFSKATVPLVFWEVETILPRVATNVPQITYTARTPQAGPYVQGKQLRASAQWKRARNETEFRLAIKSFLVLGEGILKDLWDPILGGPRSEYVPWFDFFISPEAQRPQKAEYLIHRTWHTRRGLESLIERDGNRTGRSGEKLPPLYDHDALRQVLRGSTRSSSANDDAWEDIREAGGMGPATFPADDGQYALIELWYSDGAMCVIDGDGGQLVRVEKEPPLRTPGPNPRPWRPFTILQNTPDLFLPYAVSDPEPLGDFQHVMSTLMRQSTDQGTRNMFAPKGIDTTKTDAAKVVAAFATPGGVFESNGPPGEAVLQFPPGQLSGDIERLMELYEAWAQKASGVTDVTAGEQQVGQLGGDTATGAQIRRDEANLRFRFKLALIHDGMVVTAQHYDWLDRQIGAAPVTVPTDGGFRLDPGARGLTPIGDGFARVGTEVNAAGNEYDVDVDVGSMSPLAQSEQAQKVRNLIADLTSIPPIPGAPFQIDWMELTNRLILANGEDPAKILIAAPPMPPAAPIGPGGGPLPPEQAPPVPGERPIPEQNGQAPLAPTGALG